MRRSGVNERVVTGPVWTVEDAEWKMRRDSDDSCGIDPEMVEIINKLLFADACVCKPELRSLTGSRPWILNLGPQLNPFTRMLGAALSAQPEQSSILTKQVVVPLKWLLSFTSSSLGPSGRRFRPGSHTVTINCRAVARRQMPTPNRVLLGVCLDCRRRSAPEGTDRGHRLSSQAGSLLATSGDSEFG